MARGEVLSVPLTQTASGGCGSGPVRARVRGCRGLSRLRPGRTRRGIPRLAHVWQTWNPQPQGHARPRQGRASRRLRPCRRQGQPAGLRRSLSSSLGSASLLGPIDRGPALGIEGLCGVGGVAWSGIALVLHAGHARGVPASPAPPHEPTGRPAAGNQHSNRASRLRAGDVRMDVPLGGAAGQSRGRPRPSPQAGPATPEITHCR